MATTLDRELRAEVISEFLKQNIINANEKLQSQLAVSSSPDDFYLRTIFGWLNFGSQLSIDVEDLFDPRFDYNFSTVSELPESRRGNEQYKKPAGWYRMALKVKGKYPDGDAWLGTDGLRDHSVPGEWPVSYHGSSLDGVTGIITEHYKAGERARYGRGIYSTPNLEEAEKLYAKTFKSITGKTYKMILQNRINPKMRKICEKQDYWLIPIPKGTSPEEEREIVKRSIRPYGILIKEINNDDVVTPTPNKVEEGSGCTIL